MNFPSERENSKY